MPERIIISGVAPLYFESIKMTKTLTKLHTKAEPVTKQGFVIAAISLEPAQLVPAPKTTIAKASTIANSFRTTVPAAIMNQFNLKEGDQLDWSLKAEDGELVIIIKPGKD